VQEWQDKMTSIDSIKSILNVSRGPALRANYIVNVVPPISLVTGQQNSVSVAAAGTLSLFGMKQLSMLAKDAELPGRTLSTTEHRMYGTVRQMPYGVLYDTIDITFICTNIMLERALFDLWHQFIISPKSTYLNYYKNYVGTIIIQKIDNSGLEYGSLAGELISIYTLEEAYPKTIQAQKVSYDSKGEILTLTITFSYARWRSSLNLALGNILNLDSSEVAGVSSKTVKVSEELVQV
jgi:hypothetical protein